MKAKPLLVIVLVLVPMLLLGIPSVSATHTAQNLTLTTGSGSAFVTGGYDFQATASAKKVSFNPLHTKSAVTVVMWVMPDTTTDWQHLLAAYTNATSQAIIVSNTAEQFGFSIGTGKTLSSAYHTTTFETGKVYCVIGQYNGTRTSIIVNNTRIVGTKTSGAIYANVDMLIASRASNPGWAGKIYSIAVYWSVLSDAALTKIFQSGRDYVESSVTYYWNLNEGSGTTFYDWDDAWWPVEDFNLDLVTKTLEWYSIENWTLSLQTMQATWLRVELWLVNLLTHSLFPVFEQDSWFYVLIFAALGAIVCFALIAKMIADGDYDTQVMGLLFILGLFALLVVAGVILTV